MFKHARLKLTAWYLLIIMTISISFSALIYRLDINEVERFDRMQRARVEIMFGPPSVDWDPTLVAETERRIVINLILMNLAILVISGVSGWVLAGITLNPIKEMVDEQNRFISDASHEINTPLTSLKLAMEVFLRNRKATLTSSKKLIKENIDEVDKLQALSHSLLQLSRFEVPNGNTRLEICSIKEIIDEAVKKVKARALLKKIKITSDIADIKINCNKPSLVELFVILLDNAIKYSPEMSNITLSCKTTKDGVEVFVKDEGIGISKKDLPHIFDRFYRSDLSRSRSNEIGGYGLGLSIAKKIVDNHNGKITVKSKLGEGSKFVVQL